MKTSSSLLLTKTQSREQQTTTTENHQGDLMVPSCSITTCRGGSNQGGVNDPEGRAKLQPDSLTEAQRAQSYSSVKGRVSRTSSTAGTLSVNSWNHLLHLRQTQNQQKVNAAWSCSCKHNQSLSLSLSVSLPPTVKKKKKTGSLTTRFHVGFNELLLVLLVSLGFLIVWRELNPERKMWRRKPGPGRSHGTLGAPCGLTPELSVHFNCCLLWWRHMYFIHNCKPPNTHRHTHSSCFCFWAIAREEIWSAALADKVRHQMDGSFSGPAQYGSSAETKITSEDAWLKGRRLRLTQCFYSITVSGCIWQVGFVFFPSGW